MSVLLVRLRLALLALALLGAQGLAFAHALEHGPGQDHGHGPVHAADLEVHADEDCAVCVLLAGVGGALPGVPVLPGAAPLPAAAPLAAVPPRLTFDAACPFRSRAPPLL